MNESDYDVSSVLSKAKARNIEAEICSASQDTAILHIEKDKISSLTRKKPWKRPATTSEKPASWGLTLSFFLRSTSAVIPFGGEQFLFVSPPSSQQK